MRKNLRKNGRTYCYRITDSHRWEDCNIFKKYQHKKVTKKRAPKPFLKVRSAAFTALERAIKKESLLNDLKYLANLNHTGTSEVYHSLHNKYCPKRL